MLFCNNTKPLDFPFCIRNDIKKTLACQEGQGKAQKRSSLNLFCEKALITLPGIPSVSFRIVLVSGNKLDFPFIEIHKGFFLRALNV